MTRKPLNELPLNKIEKVASDLKMRLNGVFSMRDIDVDIHYNETGNVHFISVRNGKMIGKVVMHAVNHFCNTRGLNYYIDAYGGDLRIEIF